ncbi:MAG: HlyD family efflux transporter periplasmic adaptor subunit [Myxococcota bacterium]
MRAVRLLRQLVISAAVIAAAVAVFAVFVITKPAAQRAEVKQSPAVVQVQTVRRQSYTVHVQASGVVQPTRTVVLTSQVAGKVVDRHPQLVPGGFLKAEQQLVQIDPVDYELAVQQSLAAVAQAKLILQQEQARGQAAKRDFDRLGDGEHVDEHARALALRVPHLHQAQANLQAAQSGLKRAKLQLERTQVKSPFNAVVQSATAQAGAVVTPQTPLATLVDTDQFWVKASVPASTLPFLRMPSTGSKGSVTRIWSTTSYGPSKQKWQGHVVQLMSSLEKLGNMAQLLIAVPDPLGLKQPAAKQRGVPLKQRGVPLLVGTQVTLQLQGVTLKDVVVLPAQAVQPDATVWVLSKESRLQRRKVRVLWRESDQSIVSEGLLANEQVVTSMIYGAKEGLVVHVQQLSKGQTKGSSSHTNSQKVKAKSS